MTVVVFEEAEPASRKNRPTGSTHFGDIDFSEEQTEEIGDATWGEVCRTCCVHTPKEWGFIFIGVCLIIFFLYFFLLGLELLGTAAKVLGGCTAGALFGDKTNPVAGLMIGILATVLIQSSSSTTSIIVSLVGAEAVSVRAGIYMVMGANIGTSVTNTIVALGHLGDGDELERAFAGATVHDMFNFLTVAVLFPIELITGYLYYLTDAMLPKSYEGKGEDWEGPIKKLVAPLTNKIIKASKDVTKAVAKGESCDQFYPVLCNFTQVDHQTPNYDTCVGGVKNGWSRVGLITCDKDTGKCPAFFQNGATQKDDEISGGVCFFLGIVILISCLIGLVSILQRMLLGVSTRIIYKATNLNGYIAIVVGCAITILVQSSSITTSLLTPFVGIGALRLEQMFPLTLGANLGTTVTGLLASMVSDGTESLHVALCHCWFNITGTLIWYPVPFMRKVPLGMARMLGKATRVWKGFPVLYILVCFLLIPLMLFGLSSLFEQDQVGYTWLGSIIVLFLGLLLINFIYKWKKGGLKERTIERFEKRQQRKDAHESLPDDIAFIKAELARLRDHTGLPAAIPEDEKTDEEA